MAERNKALDIVKRGPAGDGEVELRIYDRREVDGKTKFSFSLEIVKPITLPCSVLELCPACEGSGWVIEDDLPDVRLICRLCEGDRYTTKEVI